MVLELQIGKYTCPDVGFKIAHRKNVKNCGKCGLLDPILTALCRGSVIALG
jgi:hypothetical protein